MILSRRQFITRAVPTLLAAPAIVHAANIMPVRPLGPAREELIEILERLLWSYSQRPEFLFFGQQCLDVPGIKQSVLNTIEKNIMGVRKKPFDHGTQ